MENQQTNSRPTEHAERRHDSYYYVPAYTPRNDISLNIDKGHIITGEKRKVKAPPLFTGGQADIQMLDEYKQRRKRIKPNAPASYEKISVIIPHYDVQYDSDASSLTDLEDLAEALNDETPDRTPQNRNLQDKVKTPEPNSQRYADYTALDEPPEADKCEACAGKIINLRQQVQRLLLPKSSEGKMLEEDNVRLKAELARLRASQATASSTCIPSQSRTSHDQLLNSQNEVKRLRRRLSSAQEFAELIRPLQLPDDAIAESAGFIYKGMDTLSDYIVYTADMFCNVQNQSTDTNVPQVLEQGLLQQMNRTIASTELLSSDPVSAFRALLFGFVRDRIFHETAIWRDLHFDGIMLRQYQKIVEQSISPSALERYHRAAVKLTLTKKTEFQGIFIPGYSAQLEFELLRLLAPFIRSADVDGLVKRQLHTLFEHALQLRARCYPHRGIRYQIVQFAPGQVYDSRIMRVENNVGARVPVPDDGKVRRIKVCMHGLIKAHSVQETASGVGLIDELSQPFLLSCETDGQLVSDKAVVILE
ncbi:hypothetical protein BJX99DRAFT_188759 [Aspergillus californicus]